MKGWLWSLGKALEGLGLIVILIGLLVSVQTGMQDEGLKSMKYETYGLAAGGALFLVGFLIERSTGGKG